MGLFSRIGTGLVLSRLGGVDHWTCSHEVRRVVRISQKQRVSFVNVQMAQNVP